MDITVILCTYNRAHCLGTALESVAKSTLSPAIQWEVLIVDNNSTDRTAEVVESYRTKFPGRFRYLFESQPGKSNALNAGIREARGEVLAFMDDDVVVEATWLCRLTQSILGNECVGTGGRVIPLWNGSRPGWLSLEGHYTLAPLVTFDLGPDAGPLNEPPFGTNMAFRKEVFQRHGGFRTDLGPRPNSQIRSEDTEFGRRLLDAGERLHYEPSAVVKHPVTSDRLQKRYFLTWWFDKGRADIHEFKKQNAGRTVPLGIPFHLYYDMGIFFCRWMMAVDPARRFYRKIIVWSKAGQIWESYRQWRSSTVRKPIEW